MPRHALAAVAVLSCCASGFADYVADREAAMQLAGAGKYDQALLAFTKMAQGDVSDFQKSDALEQAALCASRLKRHDQAMELARGIPLAPVSKTCQMRAMIASHKWRQVVEQFRDEDIATWPDTVTGEASYQRGRAHYFMKDGHSAERDLKRAAEYLMEDNIKGLALNSLGDTYQHLLKDDTRAVETYRKVYRTRNLYKQCHAAIAIASILTRQNKHDEAIAEFERLGMDKVTIPYWRGAMLRAYADTLASAGKKPQAIAQYARAIELDGVPLSVKRACEEALGKLRAAGQ